MSMQTPPVLGQIQKSSPRNNVIRTKTIDTYKIFSTNCIHVNMHTHIGMRTISTVLSVISRPGLVLFCRKQMEICLQVTQLQARNDPQQQTKQAQFINIVSLVKYNNRFRFTHLISREIRTCSRFLEPRPRALGPSKIVKNLEKNKPMLGAESQSNSRPRASYFVV